MTTPPAATLTQAEIAVFRDAMVNHSETVRNIADRLVSEWKDWRTKYDLVNSTATIASQRVGELKSELAAANARIAELEAWRSGVIESLGKLVDFDEDNPPTLETIRYAINDAESDYEMRTQYQTKAELERDQLRQQLSAANARIEELELKVNQYWHHEKSTAHDFGDLTTERDQLRQQLAERDAEILKLRKLVDQSAIYDT